MLKQAVTYIRVSSDRQVEQGTSLDNQERMCGEWASRNGVTVLRTFREEGVSAKTLNRPEIQKLIAYGEENSSEIDYLIVYQIDRLSRNMGDFMELVKFTAKHKVELRDSTSHLESNESDELIQGMQALMAQHDNRLKSKRVTENMKRHAGNGFRMHQAPYGLRNIRDELGRPTLEPVPEVADKITYLLTEFAKGITTKRQLVTLAGEIGLTQPNTKPMSYQFLDKLLTKPIYAGLEKSSLTDGQIVSSAFEGIVPEWVYFTNQQLLTGRKQSKTEGYKTVNGDYPLRKFASCTASGKPLRGSASTGRGGKKYPRYHCTSAACKRASVVPDELHQQFIERLSLAQPDNPRLKVMKAVLVRVWNEEIQSTRLHRKQLRDRLDATEEEGIDAAEKVVMGEITPQEKIALTGRLKKRRADLHTQLGRLDKRMGTKEEAIDYALSYMGNAARMWEDASPEWKLQFQRMVFPEGITYDFKAKKFGTAKMSALYRFADTKKDAAASSESTMVVPRGVEPRLAE